MRSCSGQTTKCGTSWRFTQSTPRTGQPSEPLLLTPSYLLSAEALLATSAFLTVPLNIVREVKEMDCLAKLVTCGCCRIQYTSGEIEELDLQEIIREGHMSLITQ